ncbi:MAG: radical SAM protein [Candidatus Edwardsbacteria bacterium]
MPHEDKKQISLFLNNRCNLDCIYCYAKVSHQQKHKKINVDFAKAGINNYFSQGNYQIRFFSTGEPTLEFDTIVELHDFAYQLVGEKLVAEIQTNGVMTEKRAFWIGRYINNIWLSCDGPPDIQDTLRPMVSGKPTSAIIERNVKIMVEEKKYISKPGFVGARSTISGKNIYRQREVIDYLESLGIKITL